MHFMLINVGITHSVEINAIIIAACIPTLRPVYLVLFRKPGAEFYSPRSKPSLRLSSERDTTVELRRDPSNPQRAFANSGAEIPRDHIAFPQHGIQKTLDVDVDYHDGTNAANQYRNPMVHARDVV